MSILSRLRSWWTPNLEDDHYTLDDIAGRMIGNYADLVSVGVDRRVLATVLTGLAGCQLAMSRAVEAADHDPDGPPLAECDRLAGLLIQEIAYCAAEGGEYRGVRCLELMTGDVAEALKWLALAYDGWVYNPIGNLNPNPGSGPTVGQRLDELWHAALDVIGGQAAECLVPLQIAHSYNPYACVCERHGDRSGLPAEEVKRRAEVTRGCDQP